MASSPRQGRITRLLPASLVEFLKLEAAGSLVLMGATVLALAWANSPWQGGYDSLWATEISINFGGLHLTEDLRHVVNDGLMTVFFFVVGLEIKSELVNGALQDRRAAALPAFGALGGMLVPAGLYLLLNAGGEGSTGWGIPMATDIAFAVGVISLLGSRVPSDLRLFLLTLAIVDDIGAIAVIALFYTADLSVGWLAIAALLLAAVILVRGVGVTNLPVYVLLGTVAWFATFESGVHATIAGVTLGLITPARPTKREPRPVAQRLEHALHPWSSFGIIPLFALANAGIALGADDVSDALASPVAQGIVLGLLAGKVLGISGAAWLAVRLGAARLPEGARWVQVVGIGFIAGIGFTVSLFITGLAFDTDRLEAPAKTGILVGSVLAAAIGAVVLRAAAAVEPVRPTGERRR